MIYVDNDSTYSQLIYIPRDEEFDGATGHTFSLQRKDYVINNNGLVNIHPDGGYDGISGGTISVYVSAATGVTFEDLEVTENGRYVPTGDSAYSGVTVNVQGYDEGYHDGFEAGYSSGQTDGYSSGYTDGYSSGATDGYNSGKTEGFEAGYSSGATDGYNSGYTVGFEAGYSSGVTDGYSSGYTDGMAAQKALLTSTTITSNGHYTRENGWNEIDVNVQQTGSTLTAITATTNGEYYPAQYSAQGFSQVTVAVDTGSTYQEGYEDGEAAQKAKLKELTATTNNHTYTDQDGYSAVTVNVDTAPYYNDGYNHGYSDGQDAQKGLLSSTAFTENGVYTSETGWSGVTVQLPLTSFEVTLAPNDTYVFDANTYGVVGFSSITAHTLNNMFHVLNVRFTTTAQNQTVEFSRANRNNISAVYVNNVGEFHSSSVVIENPGTYLANVYCTSDAPYLTMSDGAITDIEITTGSTSIDKLILVGVQLRGLTGITFESTSIIETIPYAFYRATLAQDPIQVHYIEIPNSVYDICSRAFEDCDLYQIIIGENVTSIGYKAFAHNRNLTSVICKNPYGVHPSQNVFDQVPSGGTLIIPCGSTTAYSDLIAALPAGWNVVEDC